MNLSIDELDYYKNKCYNLEKDYSLLKADYEAIRNARTCKDIFYLILSKHLHNLINYAIKIPLSKLNLIELAKMLSKGKLKLKCGNKSTKLKWAN